MLLSPGSFPCTFEMSPQPQPKLCWRFIFFWVQFTCVAPSSRTQCDQRYQDRSQGTRESAARLTAMQFPSGLKLSLPPFLPFFWSLAFPVPTSWNIHSDLLANISLSSASEFTQWVLSPASCPVFSPTGLLSLICSYISPYLLYLMGHKCSIKIHELIRREWATELCSQSPGGCL